MKKQFFLSAMSAVFFILSCNQQQETQEEPTHSVITVEAEPPPVPSVEKVTMVTHKGDSVQFFIANDGTNFYWGCNDAIIPWKPNAPESTLEDGLYQLTSSNGTKVTAVRVGSKNQQNSLSLMLANQINAGSTPKEAFQNIFETILSN